MQNYFSKRRLILVLMIVHIGFLLFTYSRSDHRLKDSYEYEWQAKNIKNGFGYYAGDPVETIDPLFYSYRPPGYATFLFIINWAGDQMWLLLLLQSIVSVLTFTMLLNLLSRYFVVVNAWIYIAVFLLFFPAQLIYCNLIMSEILFQFLIFSAFYTLLSYLQEGKLTQCAWFYIIITLALLTKPIVLYFFIPVTALLYYQLKSERIRSHIAMLVIPMVIILIVCTYNYSNTAYFHFSSIKQKYELNYLAFLTLKESQGIKVAEEKINMINRESEEQGTYSAQMKYTSSRAFMIILENPLVFAKLSLWGMIRFWIEPGRWDINAYFLDSSVKQSRLTLFYYALCALINVILFTLTILFLINPNIDLKVRLSVLFILFYFLLIAGMNGTSRFRLPIYPIQLFAALMFLRFQSIFPGKKLL